MKTKISSTKKILISSVALIAALGIAASSTFAWFASNSSVTVSGFESQVVSGSDSLTMAVVAHDSEDTQAAYTALTYSSTVTDEQIKKAILGENDAANPIYLAALTPKDTKTQDGTAVYDGTAFETEGRTEVTTPNSTTLAEGSYVSFKVVFRNRNMVDGSVERYIALSSDSKIDRSETGKSIPLPENQYTTINTNIESNSTYYGSALATSGTDASRRLTAYAADAVRVSFVTNATSGKNQTTTTGKVWSPYERYATGGNADGGTEQTAARGYYLNNLASDYRKDTLGTSTAFKQKAYTSSVLAGGSSTSEAHKRISNNLAAFENGDTYTYTSVIVNVWIEGTDGDCFDAILEDEFKLTLKFSVEMVSDVTIL